MSTNDICVIHYINDNGSWYIVLNFTFFLQIDRTSLRSKFCETEPADFVIQYNIPYTKLNCEVMEYQGYIKNCSLNKYYGLHSGKAYFLK